MKLLNTTLGRILVSSAVAVIVLSSMAVYLLPSIKEFTAMVLPVERNFESRPTIAFDTILDYKSKDNYREDVVELVVDLPPEEDNTDNFNSEEDIFDIFVVSDSDDQALLDELKADYRQEPYSKRTKVFVYKINKQGYTFLVDKINPSVEGEWAVIYIINDGDQRATLRVDYVFKN